MVGSMVLSVTLTINRCLLDRYSAAVMLKTSVTVTVVVIGAETTPAELMAVMVSVTTTGAAGALKETVVDTGAEAMPIVLVAVTVTVMFVATTTDGAV